MFINCPQKSNGMYVISKDDFEDIATYVLTKYMPEVLERPCPVDVITLAEEHNGLVIKDRYLTTNGSILGATAMGKLMIPVLDNLFRETKEEFEDGTVIIDKSLLGHSQRPRRRFTIMHETSHRILHRSYYSPTNKQYHLRANKYPGLIVCRTENIESTRNAKYNKTEADWIEWQADNLAAAILMPKETFIGAASRVFSTLGLRQNHLYISGRDQTNYRIINDITQCVAAVYGVSRKAAQIRLERFGYFRDETYACCG